MGMDSMGGGVMPVYDMNRDGDGMQGGSWMWVMVLFFLLAWGNGGLFGGGNATETAAATTRSDMARAFDFNTLQNSTTGLRDVAYDGFNGLQRDLCQGFSTLGTDIAGGFNSVNAGISQARFDNQQCCCETNRNIDSLRFQSEKNTCDITSAIHAEGEATRALITQNEIQGLRDNLQSAQLQLSNVAQTQKLIGELRPCARPAYITCSPYQSMTGCCGGYGCC